MPHPLKRLVTGIPGLDTVLSGGFVEGASYIIQGHPGAGKTIFANQIAYSSVARGKRVLYVTLLAETHDRLFQSLSTLDFFDRTKLGNGIAYVSVFQTLRQEGLSAVVSLLRQETARQKADILVFDGLLNARDNATSDLDVKTFVAEVQSQAAFVGCTVLFLTSASSVSDSPEYTMVDGVVELREQTIGARALRRLQVRKSRGSAALGGYHKYEITSAGVSVYPRLEAALAKSGIPQSRVDVTAVTSGIEGLDRLLGGGLPSGSVTLLYGPSGSGKTSFGLSFLSQCSPAEPALHFGFYESPDRLALKAKAIGRDLSACLESGALDMLWQPLTENLLDKLAYRLLDAVEANSTRRLFIDGFSGFARSAAFPERLPEFFAALTNELRAKGVTTVASWELRELAGVAVASPDTELSSLLDNLVLLRNVDLNGDFKRLISVVKVRDGHSDSTVHEVIIGQKGLEITSAFHATSAITATGRAAY